MSKKLPGFLIKLLISFVFFAGLFIKVDWTDVLKLLITGNIGLYILVWLMGLTASFIGACRWQLILKAQNAVPKLWFLFKLKLIGLFFNNFLPSGAGNDLVRAFYLRQGTAANSAKALASVTLERLSGILSAVILLVVALVLNLKLLVELNMLRQLLGLLLIFLIVAGCILNRWPADLLIKLKIKNRWLEKLIEFLNNFYAEIDFYKKNGRIMLQTVWMALILQILSVFIFFCATRALGVDIQFMPLLFISPIIITVSLLPVTINGLGLTEVAVFFLYTSLGLTNEQALSSALVVRAINVLMSLIGLGLYLRHGKPQVNKFNQTS